MENKEIKDKLDQIINILKSDKTHRFNIDNIKKYEDIKPVLKDVGFKIVDEKYYKGRLDSSLWISSSCFLEIKNADINKDDAGIVIEFLNRSEIRCKTMA